MRFICVHILYRQYEIASLKADKKSWNFYTKKGKLRRPHAVVESHIPLDLIFNEDVDLIKAEEAIAKAKPKPQNPKTPKPQFVLKEWIFNESKY